MGSNPVYNQSMEETLLLSLNNLANPVLTCRILSHFISISQRCEIEEQSEDVYPK